MMIPSQAEAGNQMTQKHSKFHHQDDTFLLHVGQQRKGHRVPAVVHDNVFDQLQHHHSDLPVLAAVNWNERLRADSPETLEDTGSNEAAEVRTSGVVSLVVDIADHPCGWAKSHSHLRWDTSSHYSEAGIEHEDCSATADGDTNHHQTSRKDCMAPDMAVVDNLHEAVGEEEDRTHQTNLMRAYTAAVADLRIADAPLVGERHVAVEAETHFDRERDETWLRQDRRLSMTRGHSTPLQRLLLPRD